MRRRLGALLLLVLTAVDAQAQPRRARTETDAGLRARRAAKATTTAAQVTKPTAPLSLMDLVLKEETALQDMATRASVMHGKAKVMKADKVVDYLFASKQTSLVSELMAQNQRLRAAAIAHGGEAATKVKSMPLVLATDSHAKRMGTEEEQAAADAEEEADFAQAEREVAEVKAAAAREAAETQASVEEAMETASVKQAAKQMTAALLARVEEEAHEEEAEQQAEKEEADAQAASPLHGGETPEKEGTPADDVDEIKQLMSQLDDEEDEWLLQSVWEAMGIHNEKYQHLGQGIFGAMAAGLVIFCLISVVNASARRKPKRNRR